MKLGYPSALEIEAHALSTLVDTDAPAHPVHSLGASLARSLPRPRWLQAVRQWIAGLPARAPLSSVRRKTTGVGSPPRSR
jgi:hypothetical protein